MLLSVLASIRIVGRSCLNDDNFGRDWMTTALPCCANFGENGSATILKIMLIEQMSRMMDNITLGARQLLCYDMPVWRAGSQRELVNLHATLTPEACKQVPGILRFCNPLLHFVYFLLKSVEQFIRFYQSTPPLQARRVHSNREKTWIHPRDRKQQQATRRGEEGSSSRKI